jgi:hypothetical protein
MIWAIIVGTLVVATFAIALVIQIKSNIELNKLNKE